MNYKVSTRGSKNISDIFTFGNGVLHEKNRYLVDFLEMIDEENLNILNDCGITRIILDRFFVSKNDDATPKDLSKENIKILLSLDYSKEDIEMKKRPIVRGQNYLFLYKFLKSYGLENSKINEIIEDHIDIINDNDFTFLNNNKEIFQIKNIIQYKEVTEELFEFIVNYAKIKKVLNAFEIDEKSKLDLVQELLNSDMNFDFNKDAVKNAKFLNTTAKLEKIDYNKFLSNIIKNFNVVLYSNHSKILSYIAMFNYGGLDVQVLQNNLGIIDEYKEEFPTILYRYICKLNSNNLSFKTLDSLYRIKENYNIKTLKKDYPLILENENIISVITRDYKKQMNKKINEYNMSRKRNKK